MNQPINQSINPVYSMFSRRYFYLQNSFRFKSHHLEKSYETTKTNMY